MIRRPELSLQRTKRSIVVQGHKTSLSLETAFWLALKEIAAQEGTPVSQLVASPSSFDPEEHKSDFVDVFNILDDLDLSDAEKETLRAECDQNAEKLVLDSWALIESVAAGLMKHRKLSGLQIAALLGDNEAQDACKLAKLPL